MIFVCIVCVRMDKHAEVMSENAFVVVLGRYELEWAAIHGEPAE